MNTPAFTTNPKRIERLQYNYDEGVRREAMSHEKREQMDREVVMVTPAHVAKLFANVAPLRKVEVAE
ncbi:hypothetical protein ADEAN_000665500 [Angomonas deanei]|uniref:Uncharacterized protein n=1 Tax=Angomonas deanei TaxID=59799 RepID=A0A7G2CLM3_9TRYP|nr:hypothetical protein ADEAN_000665500 [Angomonas deanei]